MQSTTILYTNKCVFDKTFHACTTQSSLFRNVPLNDMSTPRSWHAKCWHGNPNGSQAKTQVIKTTAPLCTKWSSSSFKLIQFGMDSECSLHLLFLAEVEQAEVEQAEVEQAEAHRRSQGTSCNGLPCLTLGRQRHVCPPCAVSNCPSAWRGNRT